MQIIARVRLAPGQVGFFDELTRIHLTIANPEKPVMAGSNTTVLQRSVRSGRILLVSGSLENEAPQPQNIAPVTPPTPVAPVVQDSGVIDIPTPPVEPKDQEPAAEPADPKVEEVAPETTPEPSEPVQESTDQTEAPTEPDTVEASEEATVDPAEATTPEPEAPKKTTRKK